jgi:HSP20 family protein
LNVFETGEGDAVLVKAELPGVDKSSIEVETVGNRLMIAGTRKLQEADESSRYHRRERQAGEFRRVFTLPFEIDRDTASASYTDGMLTVRVEKAESARPRQIKIGS